MDHYKQKFYNSREIIEFKHIIDINLDNIS